MRRIIGVDPGLSGGTGVLDVADGGTVVSARLARTPTVTTHRGRAARREYDVPAMCHLLVEALRGVPHGGHGVTVVLEEQQAMPVALRGRMQGSRSTFRTGLGYGLWLGLIVALRVPYETVRPAAWKKHHGLLKMDKTASRLRAAELFPQLAPIAAADEGPSEALLLAAFAARHGGALPDGARQGKAGHDMSAGAQKGDETQ